MMVHPDSDRVPRVPSYSGTPFRSSQFYLQGFHLLWPDFPFCSVIGLSRLSEALQPRRTCTSVWALPRSLAATQGISLDFFSCGYLDGSVHRVRFRMLSIHIRIPPKRWVSPFGHPRINALLTAPRGFSQPYTSFIAFCRLGIHRIHLKNYDDFYFFQD